MQMPVTVGYDRLREQYSQRENPIPALISTLSEDFNNPKIKKIKNF